MHYRDREHRPRAFNDPGHAHELTFSCYHKFPFLSKERACRWLADAIGESRQELRFQLWAYVFMPDHVHLIVWPVDRVYDTGAILKRIKEPVSRDAVQFLKLSAPEWLPRICVRHGDRDEHHFWQQGRGHDRNIETSRALQAMIEYTHMNPVRRGLVEQPEQWKWSSAGWFAGSPVNDLKPDPIPWDWLEEDR